MFAFITENFGTVIVSLLVAGIIAAAVRKMIRDRKKGAACGCGCEGCDSSPACGIKQ